MVGDFRVVVTAAVGALIDHASRMKATSTTLAAVAAQAGEEARAVSMSSQTSCSNVRSVASSVGELGQSIREISDQAAQASRVVDRASGIARAANDRIGQSSAAAVSAHATTLQGAVDDFLRRVTAASRRRPGTLAG